MCAAVALRNVIGETLHRFAVGIVPLHGNFDNNAVLVAHSIKRLGMQHSLAATHVFDKALYPTGVGEIFALAIALIDEFNLDAVIEEGQFAYTFG